jgi:Tfp pilus assembly PilM family ATPase
VDIGCAGSRAIVSQGTQILFARSIAIGGDHITRAVATAMSMSFEETKLLRLRLAALQPSPNEMQQKQEVVPAAPRKSEGFALLSAGLSAAKSAQGAQAGERRGDSSATALLDTPPDPAPREPGGNGQCAEPQQQIRRVEEAGRETVNKLLEELDLCRRYYEATFPNRPVDRIIFVGGEARHRGLCQHIAREMGLAAQVGDPLVRMGRTSNIGIESGIDRRQPQPNWAVAIGLSLGPNPDAAAPADSQ